MCRARTIWFDFVAPAPGSRLIQSLWVVALGELKDMTKTASPSLDSLQASASKGLIVFLWLNVVLVLAIALLRGSDVMVPLLMAVGLAGVSTASWRVTGNGLSTRLLVAVALVGMVSVVVFEMAGSPWQVDVHMYFFAVLAGLVAYCDFRVILAATISTALHHLSLNFLLPSAIYPGGADFLRVVLHAAILVGEAGVLIWLALTLDRLMAVSAEHLAEVEAARAAETRQSGRLWTPVCSAESAGRGVRIPPHGSILREGAPSDCRGLNGATAAAPPPTRPP